jgi:hypothetical protein
MDCVAQTRAVNDHVSVRDLDSVMMLRGSTFRDMVDINTWDVVWGWIEGA